MVDNLSTDVEKHSNTSYLEQRALFQETTFPGTSLSMPQGIEAEMAESHWMAKTQLTKPTQISQVQWTTSEAPGSTIASFTFPEVLASVDSVIRRTLQMYAFYKMSPVFRFQLNATQFHQGQLIISFDPFRQSLDPTLTISTLNDVSPIFSRYYATGLPSVKIMASESDPVELRIPYVHPKNFLSSNSQSEGVFNLLGEIRVTVLNQLKVAEGTTNSLTLTTWVYAADSAVHVPIQFHDLVVEPTSLFSNLLSNGSNLIGNFATGNFGKGLRSGQGLVDDLGKLFGFDYPTRPLGPENTIKNVESLANARGATRSERLALDPVSGHLADSEETSVGPDEMDVQTIARMPTLIYQHQFSSTNSPQQILFYIPVTPCLAAEAGSYNGYTFFQPSYLAYLSKFFCYWRGSIQFDFEFIATRFHSGKLLIGFVPNVNPDGLTYEAASTALPSAVIDIQQTSKTSFTVPFQSTTPIKSTSFATYDETILGYIVVCVQNQLTHASNVAPEIDMNVYVRAGDDFTYLVPSSPFLAINFEPEQEVVATSDVTFQASRTGQEDNTSNAVLSYGQSVSVPKPRFGETYSMIDCMRRFTPMYDPASPLQIPMVENSRTTYFVVHPLYKFTTNRLFRSTDFSFSRSLTYLADFGKLFSCWSGSIRYKFLSSLPRTTSSNLTIYHLPDSPWKRGANSVGEDTPQTFLSGYAAATTDLSQNTSLEIEVPYYSPFNFLLTQPTTVTSSGSSPYLNSIVYPYSNGFLCIKNSSLTEQVDYRVYVSAGEDFKYFYLRSPPSCTGGGYVTVSTTKPSPINP